MNKKKHTSIAISIALIFLFSSILLNVWLFNKIKENQEQILTEDVGKVNYSNDENYSDENNKSDSIEKKLTQKMNLDLVKDKLNKIYKSKLKNEFRLVNNAYKPLYELKEEYPFYAYSNEGEIVAVSRYIKGTYIINDSISIDIIVIQNKTAENGGFIYFKRLNSEQKDYSVYNYKDCFLIFESIRQNANDLEHTKYVTDFIQSFFASFEPLYKLTRCAS